MKIIRRFVLAALVPVAAASALAASLAKKPNIIFILGDDVGIGDIACTGSDRYKTPNIDALARGGTVFKHAYAEPLCGPSRATILTGRYVFRTGATNQDATGRFTPAAETMMPIVLKQAGYVTTSIGKWGQLPLGPKEFGFDDYLKFQGSGVYWNTQGKKGESFALNGQRPSLRDKEYMPDVMHTHLVEFITQHHDDPFYIYYSMSHVHAEILPTPDSKPDTATAAATVSANSVNRRPVLPVMKPSGANTAARVRDIAITAKAISFEPSIEAWRGSLPISTWRWQFSSTTMASSTTRPMASTSPSSVSTLTEKPIRKRKKNAPMSDTGMVTNGISVARTERRNTKITSITSSTASIMVR